MLCGRQSQLVRPRVLLQVVLAPKTLAAHRACVGPQSRVYALVTCQLFVAGEALAALITAKGSFACNSKKCL